MFRLFLYRLFQRRHFWRDATFSEIADLYASRIFREAAIYIGAGFTSVYLYKADYSLVFIMSFWAIIYFLKALITPLAGILVARIGTANGTLVSNLLYIPAMLAMGSMPNLGIAAIIIFAICMGASGTLYGVCYLVEFSRVKNPIHAGKEIGFMNILEKVTIAISPVIGGAIALFFGLQVTMWVASLLFVFSAIPLLRSNNQSEKRQRITIQGFPWRMVINSLVARSCEGFDAVATSTVWGLFVVIVIFPTAGDDIYVIIGILSSVMLIVAIIISIIYGKIIDRNKGGNLLKVGVVANSIVHITRIFATTPINAVGVNIANEAATTAQNMAFLRGMFDTADISGHRIMYLVGVELMTSLGAMFASVMMILCTISFNGIDSFRVFFVIAAIVILGVGTARFPLYRK